MHKFAWHRKAWARLAAAVALVVGLGLVGVSPAAAGQPSPAVAMTRLQPAPAGEVMVRPCTSRPPTDYWWLEGGYPNPNGCQKCFEKGAAYEATGTYWALCSREVNGAILWLSCRICFKSAGPRSFTEAAGLTSTRTTRL